MRTLVEGISGGNFYHCSDDGLNAICGEYAMITGIPESTWGTVTHIGERYCNKCAMLRSYPVNEGPVTTAREWLISGGGGYDGGKEGLAAATWTAVGLIAMLEAFEDDMASGKI